MPNGSSYFKIRINTLIPDKPSTFDLFLHINDQNILYLKAGDRLTTDKINVLNAKDSGQHFWVADADRGSYRQYLHDQMNATDLDVHQKSVVLRESSMAMIEEMFENPDVHAALNASRPIISEFVKFMEAEPSAMSHLISLGGHDFYTYSHSLDVGIYSLGLASVLGFNKTELEEMGLAAVFHDVGKRHVSLDILCKKGPLADTEWTQMQQHPLFGLTILNENKLVSEGIKAACFEHHESFAGNGYPQQLVGQEIHPLARIVAITDTYDAMTTQRSYNVPMTPMAAVTMMKEKLHGRYDPEMLRAMHEVLFRLKAA